jgi:hypothetical protein
MHVLTIRRAMLHRRKMQNLKCGEYGIRIPVAKPLFFEEGMKRQQHLQRLQERTAALFFGSHYADGTEV